MRNNGRISGIATNHISFAVFPRLVIRARSSNIPSNRPTTPTPLQARLDKPTWALCSSAKAKTVFYPVSKVALSYSEQHILSLEKYWIILLTESLVLKKKFH